MATLADTSMQPQPSPDRKADGRPGVPLRALVAEDDLVNQQVVLRLLQARGFSCVVVDNGAKVLEALQVEHFDFVLMDMQMPVLDGEAATIAIRENEQGTDRHLPIIAVTAHAMMGDRERCLAAGADDYVSKPINPRLLFDAIENLMQPPEGSTDMESSNEAPYPNEVFNVQETLDRFDGDVEFLQEVAEQFKTDAQALVETITSALQAGDGSALAASAHALKGAASNFGAAGLTELGQRVEQLGAAGDLAAAESVVAQIPLAAERLMNALDAFCKNPQL
jgi:CheY-like chemotaxis protein